MQGFIAAIAAFIFDKMTEIDFMVTLIQGLFLKKMPIYEFLGKYANPNT